ncbi:MAG TPA: hypothetical protein P5218_16575, partial [Planctomycetota bacterium]|nr:hypothetical protein [Planctomycetota bacterium]
MSSDNPLLQRSGLPAFDRIQADHVAPAVKAILAESEQLLKQAESAPLGDWDALMNPLGQIDLTQGIHQRIPIAERGG